MTEEEVIIELLDNVDIVDAIPTLKIAKKVFGRNATCKQVNPILYDLEKRKIVYKVCEEGGRKPKWYSTEKDKRTLEDVNEKKKNSKGIAKKGGEEEKEVILYKGME